MVKRFSTLIAVFMTISMLMTPLASTQQAEPAAVDETAQQLQPAPVSEPVTAVSAPSGQFAPPTVLDPLPSNNMSASVPFELTSVVRSCEDQTRFDLQWQGTSEIVSMTYVLFNSSDNVNTEGQVMPEALANMSATIVGRPGDTALSVDVTLATGEVYSYLADASQCGISNLSVTAMPTSPQPVPSTSVPQSTDKVVAQGTTVGSLAITLDSGHPDVVLAGVAVEIYDMNGTLVGSDITNETGIVIFVDIPAGDYEVVPRVSAPFVEERVTVTVAADTQTHETITIGHAQGAFVTFSYLPPIEVTEGFVTLSLVNADNGHYEEYDLAIGDHIVVPLTAGTYEMEAVFHDSNEILRLPNTTLVIEHADITYDIVPALIPSGSLAVKVVTSGITFVPEGVEVELLLNGHVEQTAITDGNGIARFTLVEARTDYTARVHEVGTFPTFTSEQFAVVAGVENTFTLNWASSVQGETVVFEITLEAVAEDQWFEFAIYDENSSYVNRFSYAQSGTFSETLELPAGAYSYYTFGDRYHRVSGVEFTVAEGEVTTVSITPEVRPWETVTFVLDLQSSHDTGEFYVSIEDAEEDFDIYEGFAIYGSGLFYQSVSLPAGSYTYSTSTYYDWQRYQTVSDVEFEVTAGGNNSVTITPELRPSETVTFEVNLEADAAEQGLTLFVYDERGHNYETLTFSSGGTFQRSIVLPVDTYTYRAFGVPYEPILNGEFSVESGIQNLVSISPTEVPHESVTFTIDMQAEAEYQYLYVSVYDKDGYRRGSFSVDGRGTHTRTLQLPSGSYTYNTSSSQYNELWDVPFMVEVGGANSVAITPVPDVVTEETGTVTFVVDLQGEAEEPWFRIQFYAGGRYHSLVFDQYGTTTETFELPVGSYTYDAYGSHHQTSDSVPFVVEAGKETTISISPSRVPAETVLFVVDLHANVDNQSLWINIRDEFGNSFESMWFSGADIQTETIELPVGTYTYSIEGTPYRQVSGVPFEVKSGESIKLEIRPELAPWGIVTFNVVLTAPPSSEHYFSLDITTDEGYYVNSFDFDDPGSFSHRLALRPGSYTYSTRGFPYASQAEVAFVVAENGEITFAIEPEVPEFADVTVLGLAPDNDQVYLYVYDEDDVLVARQYHYQETTLQLPVGEYTLRAQVGYYSGGDYRSQEILFTVTGAGPNVVELAPFERHPMMSFTITNENDAPVDGAEIVVRNHWGGQVRTINVNNFGSAQAYLPLGTYTYTISAPSKYQQHEGGTISHTADGTPVDIVLVELANSDLTITFGFQDVPARPTQAELRNGSGELVATIRVPQQANSVLVSGMPHGDNYKITVLESAWYPQQESQEFSVTGDGPNTLTFPLESFKPVYVTFEFAPESGAELPSTPRLIIEGQGEPDTSEDIWLYPDAQGVYRGSLNLPRDTYLVSLYQYDGSRTTMAPFTMDLRSTASPTTRQLDIDVSPYGRVVFDLTPVAGLLVWNSYNEYITIHQDNAQIGSSYITWRSGSPTTWPIFLDPGTYQWQLHSDGPIGETRGDFTVVDGNVTVLVEGEPLDNGVVVLTTTMPEGHQPAAIPGTVTLRRADGSGREITRSLLDLTEVVIGPVAHGTYLLTVDSTDPRYAIDGASTVEVSSGENRVGLQWTSTGQPGIETQELTITLQVNPGASAPVNARVWVFLGNSQGGRNYTPDENGVVAMTVTSLQVEQWTAYVYSDNYERTSIPRPEPGQTNVNVTLTPENPWIDIAVVNTEGQPLPGMSVLLQCGYGSGATTGADGIARVYLEVEENTPCQAEALDPTRGYLPEFDRVSFRWKSSETPSAVLTMVKSADSVDNVTIRVTHHGEPVPVGTRITLIGKNGSLMLTTGPDGIVNMPTMARGGYQVSVPLLAPNQFTWPSGSNMVVTMPFTVESSNQDILIDITPDHYATVTLNVVTSDGSPIPAGTMISGVIEGRGGTTVSEPILVTAEPILLDFTPGWRSLMISGSSRYQGVNYSIQVTGDMVITLTLQRITTVGGPGISLSESQGQAGTSITVSGSGYAPNAEVKLHWGSAAGTVVGEVKAGADGTFSHAITIPSIAAIGRYDIVATGMGIPNASARYEVTKLAKVNALLKPASGQAGVVTQVTGSGYQPGETVMIRWNSATGTVLGSLKASAMGSISGKVTVPAIATRGHFSIYAVGTSGQSGSASYEVTGLATVNVNLSITTGRAGSITAVMGNGFQPGETVTIRWGSPTGQSLGSVMVSPSGTISGKVTVPPTATEGQFAIHATGGTSKQTGHANYLVNALAVVKVNLSITTGRAGSITAVMGSGFQPGETVTIRWGGASGKVLGAVKASPTGTISGKVTIPRTAQIGVFNVYISGGTSKQTGSAQYTVNRLAAAIVKLSSVTGRAGTTITVSGSGFRPGEIVTIRWGGASGSLLGSVRATTAGTFSGKIVVPRNATLKTHAVYVSGGSSRQVGVAAFTVTQTAALAPSREVQTTRRVRIHL